MHTTSALEVLARSRTERLRYSGVACHLRVHSPEEPVAELLAAQGLDRLPAELVSLFAGCRAVSIDEGETWQVSDDSYDESLGTSRMMFEFTSAGNGAYCCLVPNCIELVNFDGDGYVVEVSEHRAGPVWFACHDPEVLVFQAATLAEFLDREIDRFRERPRFRAGGAPLIVETLQQSAFRVYDARCYGQLAVDARESSDPAVSAFAASQPDEAVIFDFRRFQPGDGVIYRALDVSAPCRFASDPYLRAAVTDRPGLYPGRQSK